LSDHESAFIKFTFDGVLFRADVKLFYGCVWNNRAGLGA
jgi:hypothetical protein